MRADIESLQARTTQLAGAVTAYMQERVGTLVPESTDKTKKLHHGVQKAIVEFSLASARVSGPLRKGDETDALANAAREVIARVRESDLQGAHARFVSASNDICISFRRMSNLLDEVIRDELPERFRVALAEDEGERRAA